jgi:hypothetical protein
LEFAAQILFFFREERRSFAQGNATRNTVRCRFERMCCS